MKASFFLILAGLLTGGGLAWLTPAGRVFAPAEHKADALSAGNQDAGSAANPPAVSPPVEAAADAPVSLESLRALVDLDDPDTAQALLYRAVEKLTPAAVAVLAREALLMPERDGGMTLVCRALQDRWEQADPLAAARLSLAVEEFPRGLDRLAERDPDAAERLLTEFPDIQRETLLNCWNDILTGMTRRDPRAALERAKRGRPEAVKVNEQDTDNDISTILKQWAESDPAAAITQFENWATESGVKYYMLPQILKQLAVGDPVRAFGVLVRESLTQGFNKPFGWSRSQVSESPVIMQMAYERDPAFVRQEVKRIANPALRMALQTQLAEAMTLKDPAAAQAYAKGLSEKEGGREAVAAVAAGMAAQNAAAAAEWFLENTPGQGDEDTRAEGVSRLTRLYAVENPEEALQWTLKLTGPDRRQVARCLVETWSGRDLAAARAAVAALPEEASRLEFTRLLAENLAASRPQEVLDWARTLETPEQVEVLLRTATAPGDPFEGSAAPYEDILRSARVAVADLAKLPDGSVPEDRMDAAMADAGQFSYHDSAAMEQDAEWLNSLPAGAVRDKHLQSHLEVWINKEAMSASQWIAALPPGGLRDTGAAALVEKLAEEDPEAALMWAADIVQPELRAAHLRKTVQQLRQSDPDAARSALENAALAPAERTELLQFLEP